MLEKIKKNLILLAIVIAGLLIAGAIIYINQGKEIKKKVSEVLSPQSVVEMVINFINQNLLGEGLTASLVNVTEESGVYKINLKIGEDKHNVYVTKDGKILFIQAIGLEETLRSQPALPEEEPKKEEKPLSPEKEYSEEKLETLAKCLSEKGAKFYGAYWCGWCNKQKEIFGQAAQYLPYIECSDPKTKELTPECQKAGITGFPTWQLPNGEKSPGFKPLEKLAELSGCQL